MPRAHNHELPAPSDMLALPAIMPPFARKIGRRAAELGIHHALDQTFQDAGVNVEVEGDFPSTGGLLIASDHGQRTEIPLVQIAMARAERDPAYFLAEPVSSGGRLLQATGAIGQETILPLLRRERKTSAREQYRHRRYPNIYGLDTPVAKAVNDTSLRRASQLASSGAAAGINPAPTTGIEAANAHWGAGIGRIVNGLTDEGWETTQLSVLRADPFSNKRLVGALLARDLGLRPAPQEIIVRANTLGTPDELFGARPKQQNYATARAMTERIKELYKEKFREFL